MKVQCGQTSFEEFWGAQRNTVMVVVRACELLEGSEVTPVQPHPLEITGAFSDTVVQCTLVSHWRETDFRFRFAARDCSNKV